MDTDDVFNSCSRLPRLCVSVGRRRKRLHGAKFSSMEPFHVNLHQVNFHSVDLSDTQDADLDSLATIVNCEYHFSSPEKSSVESSPLVNSTKSQVSPTKGVLESFSEARPPKRTRGKKSITKVTKAITSPVTCATIAPSSGSKFNPHRKGETTSSYLTDTSLEIGYLKQVVANSASLNSYLTHYNMPVEEINRQPHSPRTPGRPTGSGGGSDPNTNSSPFETVAEALHLQWSVIGDKNIQPASPEEIAQVIADAEKRLKHGQSTQNSTTTTTGMDSSITSETSTLSQDLSVSEADSGKNEHSVSQEEYGLHEKDKKKELIPISAESITRTKERTSWFSSSKTTLRSIDSQDTRKHKHISNNNNDKVFEAVKGAHRVKDLDELSVNSRKSDGSVSDTASDIMTSDKSLDAEVFLKSLPPLQPLDLSEFSSSTGANNHRYSTPKTLSVQTDRQSFMKTSVSSPSSHNPMDILESLLGQNYRSPFTKSQPIPSIGPLFNKSESVKSKHASNSSALSVSRSTSEDVDAILKEKAKLEGQLEMLTQEAENVMQERAELQALVASLKLKLKSQGDKVSSAEKDSLVDQVNALQQSRAMIEEALRETQKLLDEKTEEARTLQEELQATQETMDKLHSRMKETRDDLKSKEVTIQALKNKVAELYVEVQTALQAKMTSDNDARSAKNDVATLINAKEWYQQQLQLAHEARSDLQKQLTILQANTVSHGKVIERLKSENTRIRQQLNIVQSQALKEKEALARHLEAIESDMLDREAAFQEISRERSLMENTLHNKMNSAEAESSKLSELFGTVADLEVQLEKAQNDLKRRHAHIAILESEQSELMKRLHLSQEALTERDKTVEDLEQKLIEVEGRLKAFQNDVSVKDNEILKLQEEKAATEISLRAALEEKTTVDTALQVLKGDMGKVEKSFRQMKQDLSNRSTELQKVQDEKRLTQEELERLSTQFRQQQLSSESATKDIQYKGQIVDELMKEKHDLELAVETLKAELSRAQHESTSTVEDEEKISLRNELATVKQSLYEVEQQLKVVQETKVTSSSEVSIQHAEAQEQINKIPTQADSQLLEENEDLKQKLKDVQSKSQKDLLKQKAKSTKLTADMTKLQQELKDRHVMFESNVEQLTAKLRETITDKDRLETELEMLQRKFDLSMVEQKDQLHNELQTMASELEAAQLRKQELEAALFELQRIKDQEIEEYKAQLSALEERLLQEREERVQSSQTDCQNKELALELEKERGRVAGLLQSQASLKQHVGSLEEALARRESSLVELHNHMQESVTEKEKAEHEYIKRIQTLEEGLQKEREHHRDVRKKIGQKITETKRVRRQYDSMKTEHEQLQQDFEQKQTEVRQLQTEFENIRQSEMSQRTLVEKLQSEKAMLQTELDRATRNMKDSETNNPVFAKQIETLEWQIKQKDAEIISLEEQVALSEQRHVAETENITKSLHASQAEAELLRKELSESKKERYDLQSKMAELRGALKATIQHYKLNKKWNKSLNQTNGQDAGDGQENGLPTNEEADGFDIEVYERLLDETAAKALNSKPLDDLHSCLSSLRYQISGLQRQVDDHTVAVHTSSKSWRVIEEQVTELREVVKTVCGTNTSSTTTTVTTQAAVDDDEDCVEIATAAEENPTSTQGPPGLIDI